MSEWVKDQVRQAFPTYRAYTALNLHFSDKPYDYFDSEGRVKVTHDSLMKHRNMRQFCTLANKHGEHIVQFIVAQHWADQSVFVTDMVTKAADLRYDKWRRDLESAYDGMVAELFPVMQKLRLTDPRDMMQPNGDGSYPIVEAHYDGAVGAMTMILLDRTFNLLYALDRAVDDFVWASHSARIKRFRGFVSVDTQTVMKRLVGLHRALNE